MKIITFLLKLLFLVYTLKWLGRGFGASYRHSQSGGNPEDGVGVGSLFMAVICALPTLTIVYCIYTAMGGTL